jgi:hypothetical protein
MADSKTTVAPGVTRSEYWWGYYLNGSKEALLSAGLVQEDWLQDGTVRNKRGYVVRSMSLTIDGRRIKTNVANDKRQTVTVLMNFTKAELAAGERAEGAREAAEAAAKAQREIEALPKNAKEARERAANLFEAFVGSQIKMAGNPKYDGYQLHAETISELQRLAGQMRNAIETGKVVFNRQARYVAEFKIRVQASKADPALQGFMQRITAKETVPPG